MKEYVLVYQIKFLSHKNTTQKKYLAFHQNKYSTYSSFYDIAVIMLLKKLAKQNYKYFTHIQTQRENKK